MRIVRLGSAKAAANELGLSPSALSRRVGALEEFVGKRLFTRQHQAMKLTDEGQAFYSAVSTKLEELADAVESQMESSQVWRLHLGVPSLFGGQRLFPRLPELRKLHPRLHIKQTFLIHHDLPDSFVAWKAALGLKDLEPAAIDHFDSGQLILEAAAQGLGIAIMHDDHFVRAHDQRLAQLFDADIESPYSYWFVCRPRDLENRPVRIFHDWMMKAGL